jgi:signal transduction histidine kinase/ligand-binding sensor domain-containing protein
MLITALIALQSANMWKLQTKAFVLLLVVLVSSACAFALDTSLDVGQYAHTAWKIREGFTKGTIFSIAQTPDGYLWMGTEFGLVRFDGVQAIPWRPPDGQQLPDNWIQALLVGRDGTLWIGTNKGLASWKDGKLTEYPEVAGQVVTSLVQDPEGTLWFGVRAPGRLCAVRAGKTQCYGAGSFGGSVPALYEDGRRNLWASAQTGLWRWAPGLPKLFRLPNGPVEARALIEGDNGALLMTTGTSGPLASSVTGLSEGLKQLVGGEIRSYALPGIDGRFRPTCLFRSEDGSLWVGTAEGLLHLHQGRIDRFSVADGLSGNFIRNIFEDREANVWVSTEDGLDRFREFAVPTVSENEQGLSTSAVTVLDATPDGSIWILTADGLNRLQNGHVTVYAKLSVPVQNRRTAERQPIAKASVTEIANSGLRGAVYSLGQDDRGRLWAGGGEGVFYFDRDRFVQVPGLPGGNISSVAEDGHGKIWISNLNEGLFYSTPEGVVQRIPWGRFGHKQGSVALLPDRLHGGLWLGFLDAGMAYLKDGQISSYNVADGLGNGSVNDLELGSDGAVWAATESGLSRVENGRVMTLTSKNGLPCDAVNWVMEDNDRSLWLYMSCGLVRIARSELDAWVRDSMRSVQVTVFDSSDGVRSRALPGPYGRKVTKSSDGKIWFSAPDAVSFIDPGHLPFNKLPPPVDIERVTADDKTYDATNGLHLPPRVHDLSIDYTALSLVVPEKVRFRFKLEGQDRDWREVVNVRQVQYSNLAPGKYTFRLTASNNSGVWNEEGAFVDFSIAQAYYQTTWFRVCCVAAFLVMLWGLYELRLHQLAREFNMSLEARVSERTRIARDLHDTLLQSFHGLLLRFQTVANELPPGDTKEKLDSAIDQAAEAITEGRDAVQGLRASTVETNDLAMAIRTIGEELAADVSNHNSVEFGVGVEGTPRNLRPILRDEVYRITGEALRNAFRHAQARQIEVEIHYDERHLRLRVRDDGKGIDPKVLKEDGRVGHYGLHGMRERAKLLGGKLTVWSEIDSGTEIDLSIPASNAYEKDAGRRSWLSELAEKLSGKGTAMKS